MDNYQIQHLERYTTIFKALSDPTRLKIMWLLLSMDSKISVSEIIDVLAENQYNVSKHLRILKNAGLIHQKKEGRWAFYHYIASDDLFDAEIRKTVMAIPKDFMIEETNRCTKRLSMRIDDKCVLGAESNQWIEITND